MRRGHRGNDPPLAQPLVFADTERSEGIQLHSVVGLLRAALGRQLGRKGVGKVLAAIDQTVEEFLNQALQISPQQVSGQVKTEELGYW